jgi:hypothetical protein
VVPETEEMTMMAAIKRSTENGEEQTVTVGLDDEREVPSYVVVDGHSLADAARELGGRLSTRKETRLSVDVDRVIAEVHERGQGGMSALVLREE